MIGLDAVVDTSPDVAYVSFCAVSGHNGSALAVSVNVPMKAMSKPKSS